MGVRIVCELCGYEHNSWNREHCCGKYRCPACHSEFRNFCSHIPSGWQKLLWFKGEKPEFDEWYEEQMIKKRLHEGDITPGQAKELIDELKEKVKSRHIPGYATQNQPVAVRKPTVFELPSLFDE